MQPAVYSLPSSLWRYLKPPLRPLNQLSLPQLHILQKLQIEKLMACALRAASNRRRNGIIAPADGGEDGPNFVSQNILPVAFSRQKIRIFGASPDFARKERECTYVCHAIGILQSDRANRVVGPAFQSDGRTDRSVH